MTESIKIEEKCKPSFEKHCELWGYKTELGEDGFYTDSLTQRLFNAYYDAWQASRAAIVVKLPSFFSDRYESEICFTDEVEKSLDATGVNYE